MDYRQRYGDPDEAFRSGTDGRLARVWTALPGIVSSFDRSRMTCVVQPSVMVPVYGENGTRTPTAIPAIPDVPIVFPNGGGYLLTFPVSAGDEVLLVFAARRIDFWWASGGVQPSHDLRMHDISDAFAIPGPWSQPRRPSSVPTQGASLRSEDGTYLVDLGVETGKVRIEAPAEIRLKAPIIYLEGTVVP
jgi:hypothetical protein